MSFSWSIQLWSSTCSFLIKRIIKILFCIKPNLSLPPHSSLVIFRPLTNAARVSGKLTFSSSVPGPLAGTGE